VKNSTFAGTNIAATKPGDVIIVRRTGFGPTVPAAPSGGVAPSTATYSTSTPVTVAVGGAASPAGVVSACNIEPAVSAPTKSVTPH
jgi:uncharacterized protein (TIGR03437 family)